MRARRKLLSITLIAILALSLCLLVVYPAAAQTDQTASKLQAANNAVEQAFNAVLDAEKAGANVSGLLVQLNVAGGILAQAENAYRTGDSGTAAAKADSVLPIVQQVMVAAQSARQTAATLGQNGFWETIAFTVVGSVVFVYVLFVVWRRVKRSYIKNLCEAKPELVSNE